jgi:two-component system nitrate/nitrite response regulator NarL
MSPEYGTTTVLVVDPDKMRGKLITTGLRRSRYRFEIAGCATGSAGAMEALRDREPDVALISTTLRDGELVGLDLLRRIRSDRRTTRVILLIDSFDRNLIVDAFRFGADGVFDRDEPFEALCKAIYVVSRGEVWINQHELRFLLDALNGQRPAPARLVNAKGQNLLSKRQSEIVALVADGRSNREISEVLHLSEHTVKNYMLRIFDKLGVSNRVEVILYVTRSVAGERHEERKMSIAARMS